MRFSEDNYLLTVSEVAKILKLSKLTVYKYIKDESLNAVSFGSSYRIAPQDLENFITTHSTKNSLNPEYENKDN